MVKEHNRHLVPMNIEVLRISSCPVFLYVFSGRRRSGDFQFHLEKCLSDANLNAKVLLLDLAISDKHDVYNEHLLTTIRQWILAGYVAGILTAPPCETWSEVRHLPTESSSYPRPLRSAQDPMCLSGLSAAELDHLEVSNYLLFVAIRLVFLATYHGVPCCMEHPKQPRKASRASIWRLPWIARMFQVRSMRHCLIWQAYFGSSSPKPTHLAISHLPDFEAILRKHHGPVNWMELQTLSGQRTDGTWATSQAKEYPERLNQALATAFVHALQLRRSWQPASNIDFSQQEAEFAFLYTGDTDITCQTIQPDFHQRPRSFNLMD